MLCLHDIEPQVLESIHVCPDATLRACSKLCSQEHTRVPQALCIICVQENTADAFRPASQVSYRGTATRGCLLSERCVTLTLCLQWLWGCGTWTILLCKDSQCALAEVNGCNWSWDWHLRLLLTSTTLSKLSVCSWLVGSLSLNVPRDETEVREPN